jgi:hypothetical protein
MSALRGVKATVIKPRLKFFIYGPAKVGKTTTAIQFPKPYWIDTEGSADKKIYANLLEAQGGVVFPTQDFDEVISEVKLLMREKHEYKTLIIDSYSIVYNELCDRLGQLMGTEFGRHMGEANRRAKHLNNLLLQLDMNVIITSHAKNEYSQQGMTVIGQTFDSYKKLDYLFDLIIEVQKHGPNRVACVKGTRFEEFKDGESFPLSYEEISKRYGKEILERDTQPQPLATEEQVEELERLIKETKYPIEKQDKWKAKANVENFGEMSKDTIAKCIGMLQKILQEQIANLQSKLQVQQQGDVK